MNAKGQATLFIILGVMVVLIGGIYMLLQPPIEETEIKKGFDDLSIDNLVKACISSELENALFLIGYQGGYVNLLENLEKIDMLVSETPFWLYNRSDFSLTDEFVAGEISYYINLAVPKCILDNSVELKLDISNVRSETIILNESILINAEVDASVVSGDRTRRTGRYSHVKDVRLGLMLSKAREIVVDSKDGSMDIIDMPEEMVLTGFARGNNQYLYSIIDNNAGETHIFTFGVDVPTLVNYPPILEQIGTVHAKVGERVYINYTAIDDYPDYQLTYSMMSMEIPPIDPATGEIDFIPEYSGTYTAVVSVIDGFGEKDYDSLTIEVSG
jgi:hypothetical protein